MPVLVLTFFTAFTAMMLTVSGNNLGDRATKLDADVVAVNAIAYKTALLHYLDSNPSASGVIADSSIILPSGMKRNSNWTNLVADATLYVYEVTPSNTSGLLSALFIKSGRSMLVGTRKGSQFISATGATTSALSASAMAIPDGSIVIIGK